MSNDNSETDELEKFHLELTPWQLYSLNTILQYNMVSMDDPMYSTATQVLAKEVNDTIASERFMDAMDEQKDKFREEEERMRDRVSTQKPAANAGVQ